MPALRLVLILAAVILFLVGAFVSTPRVNLVALGLAAFAGAFLQ